MGVNLGESENCLTVFDVASLWHRPAVDEDVVGRESDDKRLRTAVLLDILTCCM